MKAGKWTWTVDRAVPGVINFGKGGVFVDWRRDYSLADAESLCAYLNSRDIL